MRKRRFTFALLLTMFAFPAGVPAAHANASDGSGGTRRVRESHGRLSLRLLEIRTPSSIVGQRRHR
jgi:hypothetical protein